MNNEVRYKEYKKKKILKFLILIFSLMVIVLEVLAIFKVIHFVWGLLAFGIVYLLKYFFSKEKRNK